MFFPHTSSRQRLPVTSREDIACPHSSSYRSKFMIASRNGYRQSSRPHRCVLQRLASNGSVCGRLGNHSIAPRCRMYSNTVSAFDRDVPAKCSRLQSIQFFRHAHRCYSIHTGTFLPDCNHQQFRHLSLLLLFFFAVCCLASPSHATSPSRTRLKCLSF